MFIILSSCDLLGISQKTYLCLPLVLRSLTLFCARDYDGDELYFYSICVLSLVRSVFYLWVIFLTNGYNFLSTVLSVIFHAISSLQVFWLKRYVHFSFMPWVLYSPSNWSFLFERFQKHVKSMWSMSSLCNAL